MEALYMTGRDLIIYILMNNLEDRLVFEDGKFAIFKTIEELALELECGVETIKSLAKIYKIPIIEADGKHYILGNPSAKK